MDDEKIIALYFQRQNAAIEESDLKYGGLLRRTSYNILSSREDSEECVNDSFLAAWDTIPPEKPRSLGAYLVSITRRISLSRLRMRYADKRGGGEYALAYDEIDACLSGGTSPQDYVEVKELAGALNRFLSTLKDDDRNIFVRRYWLLEPVKQTAERLSFSESRVKSSLHRSRNKLKKYLTEEGYL